MKKIMVLILALAVILTLCACASSTPSGKIPVKETDEDTRKEAGEESQDSGEAFSSESEEPSTTQSQPEPETQPDVPEQQFSNDGAVSVDVLREEIDRAGALFGVGYVGYFEYHEELGVDFAQWYESTASPFSAEYPFFSEIDANHIIGESGYLYCILARDYGASVTVSDPDGQMLYSASNGDPILLFCDGGIDGQSADLTLTITAADGTACTYAPTLDELNYPQLLVGADRQLLSWIIQPEEETTISIDELFAAGWCGINDYGLAGDDVQNPQAWVAYLWDEEKQTTVEFSLSFCPNPSESGATDGEILMQCFYENESGVQAEWEGWWKVETEPDRESILRLDLMLMRGDDMAHYEAVPTLSETYWAMIHPNGEIILLIPQSGDSALPFMDRDAGCVELMLAMG